MQHPVIHLFSALPAAPEPGATGGAVAPEWVHLVPAGTSRTVDGRGPFRLTDPDAVIKRSLPARTKLPIDENHAIDIAAPRGEPSPARGWIVELQARTDGIWGRTEWTDTGRQLVAERAYLGLSPALYVEERTGRIVRIGRASLTNKPNLADLATLHHAETPDMDLEKLREALGLPADADETAIIAAAKEAKAALSLHAADLTRIATAAGLAADAAAKATPDGLVLHLQAAAATGKTEAELRGTVISLQTQLDTLQADRAREIAEREVDAAITAGKPIRAMRDHYVLNHTKDPERIRKELAALPSINAGGTGERRDPGTPGADGLTADQRQVCALMGVDPVKYAETLKAEKAKKELI